MALRTAALVLFLLGVISLPAHAVLIDNFTDGSGVFVTPGPGVLSTSTPDAAPFGSIIGGVRDSTAHNFSGGGTVDVFTKPGTVIGTPVMAYSSAPGVTGGMDLVYNMGGGGLGGGAGVDLTAGGENAFVIGVNFADFPASLYIDVEDADSDTDSLGPIPMPGLLTGGAPVGVPVLFSSFDGSIDFDKITSITFGIDGHTPATDLEILFLESANVPEPSTLLLVGFGLVGLLSSRRRR